MIHNKLQKLYLADPVNANLQNHSNKINSLLKDGIFRSDYKTTEKHEKDIITFNCFNISSSIEKNEIALANYTYLDELVFSYDLKNHKVCIKKLPKYGKPPYTINIFTSDILSIIIAKIKKYGDLETLNITFENIYEKFAIDSKLAKICPKITDVINYQRMITIYKKMEDEEEKIKKEVLEEKIRKDKEDEKKKSIIASKSIIYGINKNDYEDYDSYIKALNKRLLEVCEYKIKNIKRHLEANKKIYIDLLKKNDQKNKSLSKILGYLREYCYYYDAKPEIRESINKYLKKQDTVNDYLLDIYYDAIYDYDTNINNKDSLISRLNKVRNERVWDEGRLVDDNTRIPGKTRDMYDYMLGIHEYEGYGAEGITTYNNPILARPRIVQKDFKKIVDVLFQITSLKEQLLYYEEMKQNPDKAFLNFNKTCDAWNSIVNFPYWLRIGRDTFPELYKERFNLLMIKPGVREIDFNNIRVLTRDAGKEFGATKVERRQELNALMRDDKKLHKSDRLIITIPSSLKFDDIIKLINYSKKYGRKILFICEAPDTAITLKSLLFDRALSAFNTTYTKDLIIDTYKESKIKRRVFFDDEWTICVDPEYYANFMVDTPNNKNFWHRYDYMGNYKYRKRVPASLDYMINYCFYLNTYRGVLDQERCSKQFLGDYNSKEEVPLPDVTLFDLADEDFYGLCKFMGMSYDDLKNYADEHYPNRFYLDYHELKDLYSIKTEEEYDAIEKEEAERKRQEEEYAKKYMLELDNMELPFY